MKFQIYKTSDGCWREEKDGAPVPGAFWDNNKEMWVIEIETLDELMAIVSKYGSGESGGRNNVVITTLSPDDHPNTYPIIELYDMHRE